MSVLHEQQLTLAGVDVTAVGSLETARMVVVLLHGFEMQPADLSPFAHSLQVPAWFLFPRGALDVVTTGRAWWNIDPAERDAAIADGPRDFADRYPVDLAGARARVLSLVDAVSPLLDGRALVLGGFSQGGMLVCDTVLRERPAVNAVALLSASRIAESEWAPLLVPDRLTGLPVLVSHGRADNDLAFWAGEALRDALAQTGAHITWVPFDGGHEIPLVVWRALRKFLLRLIA